MATRGFIFKYRNIRDNKCKLNPWLLKLIRQILNHSHVESAIEILGLIHGYRIGYTIDKYGKPCFQIVAGQTCLKPLLIFFLSYPPPQFTALWWGPYCVSQSLQFSAYLCIHRILLRLSLFADVASIGCVIQFVE